MLAAYCPAHGATLLLSESRIRRLANTPRGIELLLECYCGQPIEMLTGRRAEKTRAHAAVI
ncbi:MAG: hypothetical protein H0V19_02885 [Euzebyales bacterium]|nr:hypothetical protein [Euzebyales bacterium]